MPNRGENKKCLQPPPASGNELFSSTLAYCESNLRNGSISRFIVPRKHQTKKPSSCFGVSFRFIGFKNPLTWIPNFLFLRLSAIATQCALPQWQFDPFDRSYIALDIWPWTSAFQEGHVTRYTLDLLPTQDYPVISSKSPETFTLPWYWVGGLLQEMPKADIFVGIFPLHSHLWRQVAGLSEPKIRFRMSSVMGNRQLGSGHATPLTSPSSKRTSKVKLEIVTSL